MAVSCHPTADAGGGALFGMLAQTRTEGAKAVIWIDRDRLPCPALLADRIVN